MRCDCGDFCTRRQEESWGRSFGRLQLPVLPVSDQRVQRSIYRCGIVRGKRSEPAPRTVRGHSAVALFSLPSGLNITSDLIQVRKVVARQQSQHHAQGLRAALIVLAGALQIRR